MAAAPANSADVLAQVQQLGYSNPQAQQVLIEQLRRSDPSMWPQVAQVFQSSMAYAQQAAQRDRIAAQQDTPGQATVAATPPMNIMQPTGYSPAIGMPPVPAEGPPRMLPVPEEGPMLRARQAADMAAKYPDTQLPVIRLSGSENSPAMDAPIENRAPATLNSSDANRDWRGELAETIRALESQTAATAGGLVDPSRQAALRLLYLTAGRRDDALRPLVGVGGAEQDFWTSEVAALSAVLQDGSADAQSRTEAAERLQEAARTLGRSGDLVVRNLAFCTEVSSFGVYKPFDRYAFKPGQEALLYAEVQNFATSATEKGFHTALRSSYEIVDARGSQIARQDFGLTEEYCRNPRNDYFLRYFLRLPPNIAAGDYTLRLAIEDSKSNKRGEAIIRFAIEDAPARDRDVAAK